MKKKRNNSLAVAVSMLAVLSFGVSPVQSQVPGPVLDTEIVDSVKRRIMLDPGVNSGVLIVSDNGVVTLSGTVSSLGERRRAAEITSNKYGVTAVINNLNVSPTNVADSILLERLNTALINDIVTRDIDPAVSVVDGKVIVSGEVPSLAERNIIEKILFNIAGVREVENRIVVTVPDRVEDEALENRIEARLRSDVLVDSSLVNVSVTSGIVTLSGSVPSLRERDRAVALCYLPGVANIDYGDLRIVYLPEPETVVIPDATPLSDAEIKAVISESISYNPRVSSANIGVTVDNGVVSLSGKVATIRARHEAQEATLGTVGVVDVINQIVVSPNGSLTDADIAAAIDQALLLDPYTESVDIGATVVGGNVTLTGKAETPYERTRAAQIASGIVGVTAVENTIVVTVGNGPAPDALPSADEGTVSDIDLMTRQAIESELRYVPGNVAVKVENGIVLLQGTVNSYYTRKRVENIAFFEGAKQVINNLEVSR
ncbi:MAG: BON domain-containing protein [Verrucomicrobiales bacterium]|nr:BON domain-containing protein [Verrucomicrobiales bacterium]